MTITKPAFLLRRRGGFLGIVLSTGTCIEWKTETFSAREVTDTTSERWFRAVSFAARTGGRIETRTYTPFRSCTR